MGGVSCATGHAAISEAFTGRRGTVLRAGPGVAKLSCVTKRICVSRFQEEVGC